MAQDMDKAQAVVLGYWNEVWCQGDPSAPARYYHAIACENGEPVDAAAFAAGVASWRSKFPDFTATVDDLLVAGSCIVTRVTYRGTHRGTFAGIPATGQTFAMMGLDIWRLEDDQIIEHWHSTDHLDLVFALGGRIESGNPV